MQNKGLEGLLCVLIIFSLFAVFTLGLLCIHCAELEAFVNFLFNGFNIHHC